VRGETFRHVVYRNVRPDAGRTLHVYIEGDGNPYLDRWTVAPDPTPVHPVMLHLMAVDPAPALYLGRPCYFGLSTDVPCTPLDWTLRRFSEEIVHSMAKVIRDAAQDMDRVELFGHSGGGALTVLLARRVEKVSRVITLAGNLDPASWVILHRYTPLQGSLNPLAGGALDPRITQVHLSGERDKNVPPGQTEGAVVRLGTSPLRVIRGADHTCCWEEIWPAVLAGQISSLR